MKLRQLFLFAVMLVALTLAMTACNLPFDIPFLNGTDPAETTTEPVSTTTGAIVTLPPVTAAPNPIVKVDPLKNKEKQFDGLRLFFDDKNFVTVEATLAPTEGRNGVSYSYTFDKDSAILTLTLYDGVAENIALQHLGKELPAPIKVCLREGNGNIEWAYEGNPAWSVLCQTADSTVNVLALLCDATGFAANDAATGTGVTFVISGNNLRFRARMWQNDGKDICTDAYLYSNSTDNFLIRRMVEIDSTLPDNSMDGGTHFKSSSDEIPAISINGTYIGGCHGYYLISSVPSGVLTEKDIGRVFTRASDGQKYVLVKVPGTAWFCPYDDEAMESGDFTKYGYPAKGLLKSGDVLTYTIDDKEKTFSVTADATQEQFRYPSNHRVQHAYLNGTVEVDLTKDGAYNAEFVDFYETYDVLYLPSVLRALMKNVGKNTNASHYDESIEDSYLTYIQTHRFHSNGSYTVYQTIAFNSDVKNVHQFGVMAEPFGTQDGVRDNTLYLYAPGAEKYAEKLPDNTYSYIENDGTPFAHKKGNYVYILGDYTLRSFYFFVDANYSKGVNVGYYPYFGIATDEYREEMIELYGNTGVGEWSHITKMYPHLFKAPTVEAGYSFSFIGYHAPTTRFDDDFYAVSWYFVGDEIYLTMNTDKAVAERTVAIPNAEYLVGLSISIEDASEGFTVVSDTVTADGITVSTTGAGYVTIKLTPAK